MLFFSKTAYENFIGMDVKSIAEALKITERSVISSLNELVENNIIIKVPNVTDKRRNDYFVNPMAAWRGNSFARKKSLTKIEKIDANQLSIFGLEESDPRFQELKNPKKRKEL
jgi:predicted transcriptional regulator